MTKTPDWAQPFRELHIFTSLTAAEAERLLTFVERRVNAHILELLRTAHAEAQAQ